MSPLLPAFCAPHASLGRKWTLKKISLENWAQLRSLALMWLRFLVDKCVYLGHPFLVECSCDLSSTSASHKAGHRICLHSLKKIPNYMVYGETYFRRFGKEKVFLPAAQPNSAKAPVGISLASCSVGYLLPRYWLPLLMQGLLASGLLGLWTLSTTRSFFFGALHCSLAFFNLVSSHPLIHSYLLSSCQCIRHHCRCWSYSRKQNKAHAFMYFTF